MVCFVVRPGFRRHGLMHELLEGAVGHAHAMGATVLHTDRAELHFYVVMTGAEDRWKVRVMESAE